MSERSLSSTVGVGAPGTSHDVDEALSTRLRDLALVLARCGLSHRVRLR